MPRASNHPPAHKKTPRNILIEEDIQNNLDATHWSICRTSQIITQCHGTLDFKDDHDARQLLKTIVFRHQLLKMFQPPSFVGGNLLRLDSMRQSPLSTCGIPRPTLCPSTLHGKLLAAGSEDGFEGWHIDRFACFTQGARYANTPSRCPVPKLCHGLGQVPLIL